MYYAHTSEHSDKTTWQPLKDHLENVAVLASQFADDFESSAFGYAGGLLHDLGKYSPEFQRRLEGASVRVDHATAGAIEARASYHPAQSRILEYIITGHHGGMENFGNPSSGLEKRLKKNFLADYSAYRDEIEIPSLDGLSPPLTPSDSGMGFPLSFYIRMLYSCLVDADFLDTEHFVDPAKATLRGESESFDVLIKKFDTHMEGITAKADETAINVRRQEIYRQCREKAYFPTGFFTLTVPTGGGKTLSSMAFALSHLERHDLKRIFYVIPYTSIIEQNAEVFRKIFGAENVLEHHSNFDPTGDRADKDPIPETVAETLSLSSENWDIPITVTTNVQFFESLFSHKPSRCRKLHNLAKSVIILDEAQMLPTGYLKPCLAALTELVVNYGATVVICTATQPKLADLLDENIRPVEIMDSPDSLYEEFRRVSVKSVGLLDDDDLSARLMEQKQVLCIVNTRRHAQELFDRISGSGNCYHLSARMCPVHRRKQLDAIRQSLLAGLDCRVVSTQLIEAGVDIDFPVVYRAMTGADSICQAAGRCNREGKREMGEVFVFQSSESYGKATPWQRRVAEIGEMVCRDFEDPMALPAIGEYFRKLYFYEGSELDKKRILPMIEELGRKMEFPFEDVGTSFSFIEDNTRDVVILYDAQARDIIERVRREGFPGRFARRLQGYSVNVYPNEFREMEREGAVELIAEKYYVLKNCMESYSESVGLLNKKYNDAENLLLII
ncbi:CRISPR-associated helicase Cas3 [Methanomicrobiaceae archaeon CYW5]|uniref:CRISPR-associated helicase Cas3' n=1 Tax=Methanovulcanius yangii TaxID=1789227 RepID=UPI0029C9F8F2|nr:CRISPR-associated helicase Cas3' [Methanovulcanius yangii]MBT8508780.1 CRISPR-associated helicase Cas3 [Methanovulcanius yangii]